jgi:hypothetical protein
MGMGLKRFSHAPVWAIAAHMSIPKCVIAAMCPISWT